MIVFELGVWQVVVWAVVTAAVVAAMWVAFGGQHRNPQHDRELAWLVWHWFTGGPLEVTHAYPRGGGRVRRTVIRFGLAVARTAAAVGFMAAVYVQSGAGAGLRPLAAWSVGGVAVLAVALVLVARLAVEWSMWRHYVQPLHWAVARAAGWQLDINWWRVHRYLRIPRGLAAAGVMVACGPSFKLGTDSEVEVEKIVKAKLGLSDVSTGWKREGIHRYVEFTRQEPVPEKVPFRLPVTRALIEAESTSSKVLLGFTRGNAPVWLDLDKAPHVLISAGTGGGKSAALTGITAQLMWHGAEIVVLDIKRISHLWLRDLPRVRYARDIGEIHQALLDVRREVERRTKLWDPVTAEQAWAGEVPRFPRQVVLFDEISSTMARLRDHWNDIRESGDPNVSPAIRAWSDILNMGRQVHVNVLAAGQRGSAHAVGSGDARENFEMVIPIDRYSKKTWDMLCPECTYVPGISHAGRAQVCIGATATETQMLWITQREAQRWVIDKRGMQPLVPHPTDAVSPGETVRERPARGTEEVQVAVTLWEASKDKGRGVVQLNFEALKKAAQRDRPKGEFPDPVSTRGGTPEFDPTDLRLWEKNRVRPMASDGVAGGQRNEGDEVDRVDENENEGSEETRHQMDWLLRKQSSGDRKVPTRDELRERFYAKVAAADEHGCRLWTGAVNGDGYAYFKVRDKTVPAHRFAYEDQIGPIPDGYTIDHLVGPDEPCTSRLCMEGTHLEAVTREENSARRHERDWANRLAPVLIDMEGPA